MALTNRIKELATRVKNLRHPAGRMKERVEPVTQKVKEKTEAGAEKIKKKTEAENKVESTKKAEDSSDDGK